MNSDSEEDVQPVLVPAFTAERIRQTRRRLCAEAAERRLGIGLFRPRTAAELAELHRAACVMLGCPVTK